MIFASFLGQKVVFRALERREARDTVAHILVLLSSTCVSFCINLRFKACEMHLLHLAKPEHERRQPVGTVLLFPCASLLRHGSVHCTFAKSGVVAAERLL